ncbi:MAG: flagellar hook-length control protein FliK [Acetivibrio ethanolgignens]
MTASNVLTQAIQMMGSSGRDTVLAKLGTATGNSFGQVMGDSLNNQLGRQKDDLQAVKQKPSCGRQFTSKGITDRAKTLSVAQEKSAVSQEVPELTKKMEAAVKDLLQEELGLTEEELEAAMTALGLDYLKLLLQENMQALVLEVNKADAMELLTDEGLSSQLNTLLLGTQEILSENGIQASMEELPELLKGLEGALETSVKDEEGIQSKVTEEGGPVVELVAEKTAGAEKKPEVSMEEENPKASEAGEEAESLVKPEKHLEETSQKKDSREGFQNRSDTKEEGLKSFDREKSQNPMDVFLQNLSSHMPIDEVSMTAAQRLEAMRDIVNQVLEQIRITIKPETTSMELTLNPENLGKVSLTVVSKEGHLTASFTAQNQVTKEALESQMQTLKESLNSQGIKVEAIEVNIESFAFDERNQMNGGQENHGQSKSKERRLTTEDIQKAFGEDINGEEETIDTAAITQSGSQVDYIA